MSKKPQTSSTRDEAPTSPSFGAESSKNYFCSSVELKHGLEVVEHDLDDLPSAFQGLFSLA